MVHEDDEERVEGLLDGIEFPDALDADADWEDGEDDDAAAGDGEDELDEDRPESADLLSDLFVAADRLAHRATDAEGVLTVVDAAGVAPRVPLPYGFARPVWEGIVSQAVGLKALLEDNTSTDDQIEDAARDLRDTLRPLV